MAYTPVGFTLTSFFSTMFTGTTMILVTLVCAGLMLYLLLKMAGYDLTGRLEGGKMIWDIPTGFKYIIILVAIAGIGLFIWSGGFGVIPGFSTVGGGIPSLAGLGISMQDIMVIVLIVVTGLALYWLVHEGKPETPNPTRKKEGEG
jgi:hypothetical protein